MRSGPFDLCRLLQSLNLHDCRRGSPIRFELGVHGLLGTAQPRELCLRRRRHFQTGAAKNPELLLVASQDSGERFPRHLCSRLGEDRALLQAQRFECLLVDAD
jgi:hypothetical protein